MATLRQASTEAVLTIVISARTKTNRVTIKEYKLPSLEEIIKTNMYMNIVFYVYIYRYTHIYIYIFIYKYIYMYVYIYINIYVYEQMLDKPGNS